jgi:hypothetical protein
MRAYDASLPLYSIHIPKCGGTSVRTALAMWFGEKFFIHYFQQADRAPQRVAAVAGSCVHGHFNRAKGLGLLDYYPDARQAVTFLRDPLEAAVSNYFFWKQKARARQLRLGIITEGSEHDYRDIDDFFRKRPLSHIPDFMPEKVTVANCRDVMDRHFIFIGLLEEAGASLAALARLLGRTPPDLPRENVSPRDETLDRQIAERFVAENALAFAIYDHGRRRFDELPARSEGSAP